MHTSLTGCIGSVGCKATPDLSVLQLDLRVSVRKTMAFFTLVAVFASAASPVWKGGGKTVSVVVNADFSYTVNGAPG